MLGYACVSTQKAGQVDMGDPCGAPVGFLPSGNAQTGVQELMWGSCGPMWGTFTTVHEG